MKLILLTLSMLMAGAVYTPPVNYAPSDTSDNPYIMVDESSLNYGKILDDNPALDSVSNDAALELWDLYPGYNVISFSQQRKYRTIIGFDAPKLKSIERLTMKISFNIYHSADVFQWFPKEVDYSFVLKSSDRYYPRNRSLVSTYVDGATTPEDFLQNYAIPYISVPQDIFNFEEACNDATVINANKKPSGWPNLIFNKTSNSYLSVTNSDIFLNDFYVIMPVRFDISRVWISVAGVDTNDNPVSDGLDSSGVPFTKDIGGTTYKYIDLDENGTRAVYFTQVSTITSIVVTGDDVGGHEEELYLRFGDYDFEENIFNVLLREYWLTDVGDYITPLMPKFTVLASYDAVLSSVPEGDVTVRIFYESDGVAVYQNIVGTDGVENPTDNTPTDVNSNWWDDYFVNPLSDVFSTITLVLRIVLLVVGLGLIAWAVILIVRSLNKSSKGGKK